MAMLLVVAEIGAAASGVHGVGVVSVSVVFVRFWGRRSVIGTVVSRYLGTYYLGRYLVYALVGT